jgi:uncharacterized coiled-coil protein SlyX
MKRYLAVLSVAAVLSAGMFAAATAQIDDKGPLAQLRRRVTDLEIRADRQRRAIAELKAITRDQQEDVDTLLTFRTNTNNSITLLFNRTSKLDSTGLYDGPVRANQVSTTACANADAVWEAGLLVCQAPAP